MGAEQAAFGGRHRCGGIIILNMIIMTIITINMIIMTMIIILNMIMIIIELIVTKGVEGRIDYTNYHTVTWGIILLPVSITIMIMNMMVLINVMTVEVSIIIMINVIIIDEGGVQNSCS